MPDSYLTRTFSNTETKGKITVAFLKPQLILTTWLTLIPIFMARIISSSITSKISISKWVTWDSHLEWAMQGTVPKVMALGWLAETNRIL